MRGIITKTFVLYLHERSYKSENQTICNADCIHCYYRYGDYKLRTLRDIKKDIDRAILQKTNHIQVNGAEPTIHPDFLNILKYIKQKSVRCSVITNGLKLSTFEFAESTKPYVNYYLFSIHGIKQNTINSILNVDNANLLIKKALLNLNKLNIDVHINFTILQSNYTEIITFVEKLSVFKNIRRFNFISFNPWYEWQEASSKTDNLEETSEMIKMLVPYEDVVPYLEKSFDIAYKKGIGFAIRYFPFCKLPKRLWPYNYSFSTALSDNNEWNRQMFFPNSFTKHKSTLERMASKYHLEGNKELQLEHAFSRFYKGFRTLFKETVHCENCSHYLICDTPHKEQIDSFPQQTFNAIKGRPIKNPFHFVDEKIIVSIIIPTYNNRPILELSLLSVLQQSYPLDQFEIIIVDDGSNDETEKLVRTYQNKGCGNIRYFFQEDRGYRVGQARNLGAKNANGKYLIFINQDIIATPNLIKNYLTQMKKFDVVQGYTAGYSIKNDELQKQYSVNEVSDILKNKIHNLNSLPVLIDTRDYWFTEHLNSTKKSDQIWKLFLGTNFCIKKDIFLSELFDENFVGWGIEDQELGYRLQKKRYLIKLDKSCLGLHLPHIHETAIFDDKKVDEWINNMVVCYQKYNIPKMKHHFLKELLPLLPKEFLTEKRILKIKRL